MVIALILIFVGIFCILLVVGREPIPWSYRLRRVYPGVSLKAEWIAPEDVILQVRKDYLDTVEWLSRAASGEDIQLSSHYLTGRFLARFQTIINYQNNPHHTHFTGVMTARHHIQVRYFSDDGSRCLVVDSQTERRMESHHLHHNGWSLAQDLGDGAVVYQMCYDTRAQRWKIESFIQELPAGWGSGTDAGRVRLLSHLPTTSGRDF